MSSNMVRELDQLKQELRGMCSMVVEAIDRSIDAFLTQNAELAEAVVADDKAIDLRENTIEEHCGRILALNQPYADDFRHLFTIIRTNHSLERMGDHAKSLARCVISHSASGYFIAPEVRTMARIVPEMVHGCVRALQMDDVTLADDIRRQDKLVNEAYNQAINTYAEAIQEAPDQALVYLRLAEAIKHLERCADMAKSICKDIVYSAEGRVLRHGGKSDKQP